MNPDPPTTQIRRLRMEIALSRYRALYLPRVMSRHTNPHDPRGGYLPRVMSRHTNPHDPRSGFYNMGAVGQSGIDTGSLRPLSSGPPAQMAELVDAQVSGTCGRKAVE